MTPMAYSLDLRTRIVYAVDRGVGTMSEIAALFGVNESFIYKLLRQRRERGDIAPLPHGGGAQAKLNKDHLMILTDLVAKSPDATLEELCEQMKKKARVEVSVPTICRALQSLGLSRKKRTSERPRDDPVERAKFAKEKKRLPVEKLVFVDEFGSDIAMTPTYARSPQGERAAGQRTVQPREQHLDHRLTELERVRPDDEYRRRSRHASL